MNPKNSNPKFTGERHIFHYTFLFDAYDVVEFVFVFAIVFRKVFLIDLFEVVEIIGAFGIDTFMYDEVFPLFLWNKGVAAVGAAELHG